MAEVTEIIEDAQAAQLMAAYLEYLKTIRRFSANTCSNYQRDLHYLLRGLGATSILTAQNYELRRLLAQLHGQGLQPRSLARMLSAWRSFYRWLAEQGFVQHNPLAGLRAPKAPQTLPKALSADLMQQLLTPTATSEISTAPNSTIEMPEQAFAQLRDQAMFELLYSSGLRLSELVSVDCQYTHQADYQSLSWIDWQTAEVAITGKGGKQRTVPIGAPALRALQAWRAVRSDWQSRVASTKHSAKMALPEHQMALFVTAKGLRIHPRVVQLQLKKMAQQQGIPAQVHPHVLRHSFASHLLQSSGDLRAVQELLGHANISTTQIYTSLDWQHLAKVYDAAHPRAKLKRSNKD